MAGRAAGADGKRHRAVLEAQKDGAGMTIEPRANKEEMGFGDNIRGAEMARWNMEILSQAARTARRWKLAFILSMLANMLLVVILIMR